MLKIPKVTRFANVTLTIRAIHPDELLYVMTQVKSLIGNLAATEDLSKSDFHDYEITSDTLIRSESKKQFNGFTDKAVKPEPDSTNLMNKTIKKKSDKKASEEKLKVFEIFNYTTNKAVKTFSHKDSAVKFLKKGKLPPGEYGIIKPNGDLHSFGKGLKALDFFRVS